MKKKTELTDLGKRKLKLKPNDTLVRQLIKTKKLKTFM